MVRSMSGDPHVDKLMDKLVRAIEVSLRATEASRAALHEILRRGAATGIFFAGASAPASARAATGDGSGADGGRAFDLTPQDRDFLRSLSIRPDPRPDSR
jgi:hypothetical protein